jgi:ribosome maturation factor RimP
LSDSQLIIGPADPVRLGVEAAASAALIREGFELVDIEFSTGGPLGPTVVLFLDREGGINLDQCADASRLVGSILDVEDPINSAYRLEVSSPGLDRRVATAGDLARFAGRQVAVRMQAGHGRKNLSGELGGLRDGLLDITEETGVATVAACDIRSIHLIHDFGG